MIGYAAGMLTTCSFVPQVVKTFRSKRCDDVSAGMLTALASGVLLWLIYGLFVASMPIILANAVTLVLLVALLLMKAIFRTSAKVAPGRIGG